ncbi:unnamed protein product [Trichogramma brassicae]|uniref:Uncharacterized protein n=1 Tax=Trichogramma brassicae TaxID=86971 RepID=A0A6H5J4T4_9HYME|nr:unnamed protein product [Trichogramma brassicae]
MRQRARSYIARIYNTHRHMHFFCAPPARICAVHVAVENERERDRKGKALFDPCQDLNGEKQYPVYPIIDIEFVAAAAPEFLYEYAYNSNGKGRRQSVQNNNESLLLIWPRGERAYTLRSRDTWEKVSGTPTRRASSRSSRPFGSARHSRSLRLYTHTPPTRRASKSRQQQQQQQQQQRSMIHSESARLTVRSVVAGVRNDVLYISFAINTRTSTEEAREFSLTLICYTAVYVVVETEHVMVYMYASAAAAAAAAAARGEERGGAGPAGAKAQRMSENDDDLYTSSGDKFLGAHRTLTTTTPI